MNPDLASGSAAVPDAYPRAYRLGFSFRIAAILFAMSMAGASLFGIIYTTIVPSHIARPLVFAAVLTLSLPLWAWAIASAIKSCVILDRDGIEVVSLFRTRRMERKDIGAKMYMFAGYPRYLLIPRSKKGRWLDVGLLFQTDETFKRWLASIPDVDREYLRNRRQGLG